MNDAPETGDEEAFVLLDFKGDDLDPEKLVSLIPLTPVRPRRKGAPLAPAKIGKGPIAKTGYCGFTTADKIASGGADKHVECVLAIVENRIDAIRSLMSAQSLEWRAVLFEGDAKGQSFADVGEHLLLLAARLGLPLAPKEHEAVTFMSDVNASEPDPN